MNVTVAICTWNRADLLDQTLAQMHKLHIPPGVDWELLVVNNNCTDHTDQVIARHAAALPLRRLFQPKQGLSDARNCAIDACQGDLLLWTDDDVIVSPGWLTAFADAARSYPSAAFFGGPIVPWYEQAPPKWISRNIERLAGCYALVDPSKTVGEISGALPFGANFALRRDIFELFSFDSRLGPHGTDQIRGDETELLNRVREAGHRGQWVPEARVQHFIPKERLTRRYIHDWFSGHGQTLVRNNCFRALQEGTSEPPRWVYRQYLQAAVAAKLWRAVGNGPRSVAAFTTAAIWRGVILQCKQHRTAHPA